VLGVHLKSGGSKVVNWESHWLGAHVIESGRSEGVSRKSHWLGVREGLPGSVSVMEVQFLESRSFRVAMGKAEVEILVAPGELRVTGPRYQSMIEVGLWWLALSLTVGGCQFYTTISMFNPILRNKEPSHSVHRLHGNQPRVLSHGTNKGALRMWLLARYELEVMSTMYIRVSRIVNHSESSEKNWEKSLKVARQAENKVKSWRAADNSQSIDWKGDATIKVQHITKADREAKRNCLKNCRSYSTNQSFSNDAISCWPQYFFKLHNLKIWRRERRRQVHHVIRLFY
jgi:hypothetical protein